MIDKNKKLHSCAPYTMQPCNSNTEKCNTPCNFNATPSLKALAAKALLVASAQHPCNFGALNVDKKLHEYIYATYGITIEEIKDFTGEDWEDCKNNQEALKACADALVKEHLVESGIAPTNYTHIMECVHCGIVPCPPEFADGKKVLGCPWCYNCAQELPIPKIGK